MSKSLSFFATYYTPSNEIFTLSFLIVLTALLALAVIASPLSRMTAAGRANADLMALIAILTYLYLTIDPLETGAWGVRYRFRLANGDDYAATRVAIAFGIGFSLSLLRDAWGFKRVCGTAAGFLLLTLAMFEVIGDIPAVMAGHTFNLKPFNAPTIYVIWVVTTIAWSLVCFLAIRKHDLPRQRLARGECPFCGYDLRGTTSSECPECGAKDSRKS